MKTSVLFLLAAILCTCNRVTENSVKPILLLGKPESKIANLSDIASDIDYIPLETDSNSLIRYIYDLKTSEKYFYVKSLSEIICFDKQGSYLFKLNKQGRGPEEYNYIYDFDVSPKNNLLVINTSKKILIYNQSNKGFTFKNSLKCKFQPSQVRFIPNEESMMLSYSTSYGYEKYRNVVIDLNGDTLVTRPNYYKYVKFDDSGLSAFKNDNISFVFGNRLHFKEMFSDTIFYLDHSLKILPYLILNSEGKLPTSQYMGDWRNVFNRYTEFIHFNYIIELPRYLIYSFNYANSVWLTVYDKSENKKFGINSTTFLKDDLIGGLNFEPKFCCDGVLYSWVDALSLRNFVESDAFKNSIVKEPQKKMELKTFINSINDTDNPILIAVTLKN